MGQKVVNVVYKVNDSELTKAKATIQTTQAATKQAEQAMTDYGKSAQQTGGIISNTIYGMTQRMQQLKAQIELTTQTDVDKINKLKAEYQTLKSKVDEFNQSLANTNKTGTSAIGVFNGLGTSIMAAISIAAIKQIGTYILEMNTLAGKVESVNNAFKRTFPNSQLLIQRLREATHGTVNDFLLMQKSIEAFHLGIDVQKLPQILEFAATYAQQTGKEMDYVVESIVNGIGRKSIRWLDNLGITAVALKKQLGDVGIQSVSTSKLTDAVAVLAGQRLKEMGGYAETTETKVKSLGVAWDQLNQQLANKASSSGFLDFLIRMSNYLRTGLMDAKAIHEEFVTKYAVGDVGNILKDQKLTNEELEKEIKLRQDRLDKLKKEREELVNKSTTTVTDPFDPFTKKTEQRPDVKRVTDAMKETIDIRSKSIELLQEELKRRKDSADEEQKEVGILEALTNKLTDLKDALNAATSQEQVGRINAQIAAIERYKNALSNFTPVNFNIDETANDAAEAEAVLKQAQDDINKDADESYKEGLNILHKNQGDELNLIKAQNDEKKRLAKEQADAEKQIEAQKQADKQRLTKFAEQTAINSLQNILYATLINREYDLQNLNDYYDAQITAAGSNEAAKKKIEAERKKQQDILNAQQLEQDKENAEKKIEIDTAVAIIKTFAEYGFTPFAAGMVALLTAASVVQLATVKKVNSRSLSTRAYAEGGHVDGPGTETSDSIPAWLSKNEFVVKASAAKQAPNLLEAINDRKIDDRILVQLANNGGAQATVFDDSKLIAAIERNRPDYEIHGYTLMKSEQIGANFRKTIRSKVQGYK